MKYKVGDKVRIKSLDWYNKNKDADGFVHCGDRVFDNYMSVFCGSVVTIGEVSPYGYDIREDMHCRVWTDEMIEGLADEIVQDTKTFLEGYDMGYEDGQHDINEWILPEGFEFHDENGNVINTMKIVLKKKKKKYPKTYEECTKILLDRASVRNDLGYKGELLVSFQKLLVCRDAYWKIAGEEMGLSKPWKPDWNDCTQHKFGLYTLENEIRCINLQVLKNIILVFPTEEMRDAFYVNFKELIELVKELL